MLPSSRAWHQEPYILKSRTPWKLSRFTTPLVVSSADRRVPVRQLRSDQGTNFIGANFIGAKRGTLSHADLRDRSDCEQPPANRRQPKRPRVNITTDAKPYPHNENKAGSTTAWHLPKGRTVLKETLEDSPAFIMRILDPLEKGISP